MNHREPEQYNIHQAAQAIKVGFAMYVNKQIESEKQPEILTKLFDILDAKVKSINDNDDFQPQNTDYPYMTREQPQSLIKTINRYSVCSVLDKAATACSWTCNKLYAHRLASILYTVDRTFFRPQPGDRSIAFYRESTNFWRLCEITQCCDKAAWRA